MKTTTKTLLIIAVCFMVGGLLLAGVGTAMGGTTQFSYEFTNGKFEFNDGSESYVGDTVKVSKFDKLVVNSNVIDVEISDSGKDYEVTYYVPKNYVPTISDGDTLTIKVPNDNDEGLHLNLFSVGSFNDAKITINIPSSDKNLKFEVESSTGDITVENIDFNGSVKSSTGDVAISDAELGDVELITSTGDIYYSNIKCPSLNMTTSTGQSHIDDSDIDSLTAKTQTGDIDVNDSKIDSVKIEGSTSDIEFEDVETDDVYIKVSSGECELDIDGSAKDYSCSLSSSTGDIEVNGTEYEKQYTLNGGSKNITVTTSTGDITVDFH